MKNFGKRARKPTRCLGQGRGCGTTWRMGRTRLVMQNGVDSRRRGGLSVERCLRRGEGSFKVDHANILTTPKSWWVASRKRKSPITRRTRGLSTNVQLTHAWLATYIPTYSHLMKATGMTSIVSRKRVAVNAVASAGLKKRKVEIKATMSAPLHCPTSYTVLTPSLGLQSPQRLPTPEIPLKAWARSSRISNETRWARRGGRRSKLNLLGPIFAGCVSRFCTHVQECWFVPYSSKIFWSRRLSRIKYTHQVSMHVSWWPRQRTNSCTSPAQDIYSWSRLTPLDGVKAVVIGQARPWSLAFLSSNSPLIPTYQDPYHDVGQAHGQAPTQIRATYPRTDSTSQDSLSQSCRRRNYPDR